MVNSVAGDPEFRRIVQAQLDAIRNRRPYHSLELPDGRTIQGMIPVERLRRRLAMYPIPPDLRGKRVLDVGAASGWNSFELEKRGASVVALDCVEYPEFHYAKRVLNSKVEYLLLDADEISKARLAVFDYVIFFGVLYHLRHPLLALEKICAITGELACVESYVIDPDGSFPGCAMEFYETTELGGQQDNWWGPTVNCLAALCRSAGFGRVEKLYVQDRRAGFACIRRWAAPSAASTAPPPFLCFALNNRNFDSFFSSRKDEYICVFFKVREEIERDNVFVEVDGFAVPALTVAEKGPNRWQVNVRVPPGLDPGQHAVRVRTACSEYSNPLLITMLAPDAERPCMRISPDEADGRKPLALELLGVGPDPAEAVVPDPSEPVPIHFRCSGGREHDEVFVEVDGRAVRVLALGFFDEGVRQANCRFPRGLQPGWHDVRLRATEGSCSNSLRFRVEGLEAPW